MTKKLKDSLHATLNVCYNGDNAAEAVKALLRENKKELEDKQVWDEVVGKLQSCLAKHNQRKGTNLHIGDIETLFLSLGYLDNNHEEAFQTLANGCLDGLK